VTRLDRLQAVQLVQEIADSRSQRNIGRLTSPTSPTENDNRPAEHPDQLVGAVASHSALQPSQMADYSSATLAWNLSGVDRSPETGS